MTHDEVEADLSRLRRHFAEHEATAERSRKNAGLNWMLTLLFAILGIGLFAFGVWHGSPDVTMTGLIVMLQAVVLHRINASSA